MAICDDCFQEFLHPLIHELMDKNEAFNERNGPYARWDWDSDASTITFTDPAKPAIRIDVTVVGTTEGDSWEWSWANLNFEPKTKRDMEKVHEFGKGKGYDPLTTAFLDADEFTGWEMTAVAAHVLGAPGAYRFPTGRGFCYVIYRDIEKLGGQDPNDAFGAMRGTVTVAPGVDLTEPTGEKWGAESDEEPGGPEEARPL